MLSSIAIVAMVVSLAVNFPLLLLVAVHWLIIISLKIQNATKYIHVIANDLICSKKKIGVPLMCQSIIVLYYISVLLFSTPWASIYWGKFLYPFDSTKVVPLNFTEPFTHRVGSKPRLSGRMRLQP